MDLEDETGQSTAAKSASTVAARATEDAKNFLVWGSWHGHTIEKPLLTEKVRGAVKKTLIGKTYCVVLRTDGVCVSWGESKQGCLGVGQETTTSIDPKTVRIPDRVVDIAQGGKHVLALTQAGKVYSWGHNEFGQLGVGDLSGKYTPKEVTGLSDSVKQILAVDNCSFALTEKGDVFAWGDSLCGLIPIDSEEDNLMTATPLLGLHPYAIRHIDIVHGDEGQKTMMAYIDYYEADDHEEGLFTEPAEDHMEAEEAALGGAGDGPPVEDKDSFLFQGIHMLRECLDTTKVWYEEITKLRHGAPYELDADDNFLIKSNPIANTEEELKKIRATEVTTYDMDANSAVEVLYSALTVFDKLIKCQELQNRELKKIESKSAKLVGALFMELCLLRREKVQRTILARDMLTRKQHVENLAAFAQTEKNNKERYQQCISQLRDNSRQIRQAASRHDTALLSLQNALIENCELRIANLDMELQMTSRVVPAGELQGNAIAQLRQVWTDLKSFSLTTMFDEVDEAGFESGHLHQLVRMVNTKIDGALDQFSTDNQLFGHEGVLPTFIYELLIETGELRKALHAYQLRTLLKEKRELRAAGLAAANADALEGETPRM
ncbi:unnamed protein product [Amoebophrya sp. A120]|nr:unnamed protein product [Amoebophrya sp. A120]|eukprot:GSA120T00005295001.1